MTIQLDRINPKFRHITDLLLFSNRTDVDMSNYKRLLRESPRHFEYLWDRFERACEIYWEDGEQFWRDRLSLLLAVNDKNLSKYIESHLETRMFEAVRNNPSVDIAYDNEFLQYVAFCKAKYARNESLLHVREYLIGLPSQISTQKLISVVNAFVPFIFGDLNEYVEITLRKVTQSARHFELLLSLEEYGLTFDRHPIAQLVKDILIFRVHSDKNRRAFFSIINDPKVMAIFKGKYDVICRSKLLELLRLCDYCVLEDGHLRNFKNLIELDPTLADEVAAIYADKLYLRTFGHKRANADKLIRLLKNVPQVSPKKMLAYLASNNKMTDIKYILSSFPELKRLAAFV